MKPERSDRPRRTPLFPVAAGLLVGIVFDRWGEASGWVYFCVLAGCSASMLIRRVRSAWGPVIVLAASWCVGGVLHMEAARTIPATSIERYAGSERRIARVRGVIASPPRVLDVPSNPFQRWSHGAERTAFLLDVASIEGERGEIPVTGRIRVTVHEAVLDLAEAQRVELFGWLYRSRPPRNPGSYDWSYHFRRQGVVASLRCEHRESAVRLAKSVPALPGFVSRVRTHVRGLLTDDLAAGSDEEAGLLEAMILGHRSQLDRRLNDVFIRAGCIHFLAVSGLHLAVPMSFVWWVGRRFGLEKRRCAWLMLLVALTYVTIAEPRPPILRASIMGVLLCLTLIAGRARAGPNWLCAAAIILVILSPLEVFAAGFQLSFVAVCGIMYLPPALREGLRSLRGWYDRVIMHRPCAESDRALTKLIAARDHGWRRVPWRARRLAGRYVLYPFGVSLAAWLVSLPIVATHFQQIHVWAFINSLLVFPFVYLLLILGFFKILAVALMPGWAFPLTDLMAWIDTILIGLVEHLGALPGATWNVPAPPWLWTVCWYALWVGFCLRFRRAAGPADEGQRRWAARSVPSRSRISTAVCAASLILLVASTGLWVGGGRRTGRLVATMLSVGAGSATVLELPDGSTVLMDAGSQSPYDVGHSAVVPFLRHRGIGRIDRLHISHPNLDHLSGIPSVVDEIETGEIHVNEYFSTRSKARSPSRHLLDLLAERGYDVKSEIPASQRWDFGGAHFQRLWPIEGLGEAVSTNDTSSVIRVSFADRSILFTGDIEDFAQRALIGRGGLHADVLVLPHHGSVRSSSQAFVDAVGAEAVIRSSHARMAETFNGLQAVVGRTPLFNTADVGAVRVVIDGDGIEVSAVGEQW